MITERGRYDAVYPAAPYKKIHSIAKPILSYDSYKFELTLIKRYKTKQNTFLFKVRTRVGKP